MKPAAPILAGLALALPPLAAPLAQQSPAIAAYTVVDGAFAPEPLAGLTGDPVRGREVIEDPELGGCIACHAAPGRAAGGAAPRILLDRIMPPPPLDPEPDAAAAEETPAPPSDGIDSQPEAPVEARLPLFRAEAMAAASEEEEAYEDDLPRAADLGLREGPDLSGIGARRTAGALRLWLIDPGFFGVTDMPAYHAVDFALAEAQPDLRQPWLTPQQIEDALAYLLSLDAPPPDGRDGDAPEAEAAISASPDADAPIAPPGVAEEAPAATGEGAAAQVSARGDASDAASEPIDSPSAEAPSSADTDAPGTGAAPAEAAPTPDAAPSDAAPSDAGPSDAGPEALGPRSDAGATEIPRRAPAGDEAQGAALASAEAGATAPAAPARIPPPPDAAAVRPVPIKR